MSKLHLNDLTTLTDAVTQYEADCAEVEALDAFSPGYLARVRDLFARQRTLEHAAAAEARRLTEWLDEIQAMQREDDAARGTGFTQA